MEGRDLELTKIKVLVVDDSAFMRKLISDFLSEHPELEVIGTARNGEDAIKKWKALKPDVITLDVEMPVLNGLETLKAIMQEKPTPVVMLSSTTREGADTTLHAIQAGAVDFITKPSGSISIDLHKIKADLIEKVRSASKANLSGIKTGTKKQPDFPGKPNAPFADPIPKGKGSIRYQATQQHGNTKKLICIGTSTGGPRALQQVLTLLPKDIDAPILVVQHMPAGFTKSLANRLDSLSQITVKEAEDGELIKKGVAYIAPGGLHLEVKEVGTSLAISLGTSEPRNGHRPSVDVMFESISKIRNIDKVAVIMTGMGSDGAKGLVQLKKSEAVKAIAESKNTSVVFGMPKSAIATHLVDEVADLENIAESIMKYI